MSEQQTNEEKVSLGVVYTNLTEEEARTLTRIAQEIADQHGVQVEITDIEK